MRLIFYFLLALSTSSQATSIEHRPSNGGVVLLFVFLFFLTLIALYLKTKKDPDLFKKIFIKHNIQSSSLVIEEQKNTLAGDRFYVLNVNGQKFLCCVSKQGSMALQSVSKESVS